MYNESCVVVLLGKKPAGGFTTTACFDCGSSNLNSMTKTGPKVTQ